MAVSATCLPIGAVLKACRDCGESKALEEYDRTPGTPSGRHAYCKPCRAERRRAWYQANITSAKESQVWRTIKHKYGITQTDYERILADQGGGCAICAGPQVDRRQGTRFCIDHDHATGAVRGLLCTPCNLALGYLRDREDLLTNAIDYLRRTTAERVV